MLQNEAVPKQYTVSVSAMGPFGSVPTLTYVLNLQDFNHSAVQPIGTLHEIASEVKSLASTLERITDTR